jgi:DNA mismatch endonuclease, patch repair protein
MADVFSKSVRSEIMGRIRGVNTRPEMMVRSFLHIRGFRFRLHAKALPGKPDIVLPRYKTAIFVHGCFWHGHSDCKRSALPSSHRGFWSRKISGNKKRDSDQIRALRSLGWCVLVIWECETKKADLLSARLKVLRRNKR